MIPIAAHVGAQAPPTVTLESRCPHAFRVLRLGGATRWFRERGYIEAIHSGDHAFDERWAVESDDREFAEALIREREARGAIARLEELGSSTLWHSGRKLYVVFVERGPQEEREQRRQDIRGQLAVLDGIIVRLCRNRTFPHRGGGGRVAVASVLLGVALAAGLTGLALFADELLVGELAPLMLKSLLVSLPFVLVLCFAMARLLSGRSRSHRDLGLVASLSLLALPALGVGAALTLNRLADVGPATLRVLPVLELLHKRGDGDHVSHYAVVPEWREGARPTRRIQLGRAMSERAVAGRSRLLLTTSPGALGAERKLALELESDTAAR